MYLGSLVPGSSNWVRKRLSREDMLAMLMLVPHTNVCEASGSAPSDDGSPSESPNCVRQMHCLNTGLNNVMSLAAFV